MKCSLGIFNFLEISHTYHAFTVICHLLFHTYFQFLSGNEGGKKKPGSTSARRLTHIPPANSKVKLQTGGKLSGREHSGRCSIGGFLWFGTSAPGKRGGVIRCAGEIKSHNQRCACLVVFRLPEGKNTNLAAFVDSGKFDLGLRCQTRHFLSGAGQWLLPLSGILGNVVQELLIVGGISALGGCDYGLRFSQVGEWFPGSLPSLLTFLTRPWDQLDSVFGRRAEKPRLATEGRMEGRGRPLAFLLTAEFSACGLKSAVWLSPGLFAVQSASSSTFHTVSYFLAR